MQGFKVAIASNGAESLVHLKKCEQWDSESDKATATAATPSSPNKIEPKTTPDPLKLSIILMDIEMPVMNGIEATRRIRESEKSGKLLSHIPIIAITANARLEQISVAKEAGMDDVVSKPFRIPELLSKIEVFTGPLKRKK
jgi:CheY-like chemotaxis protein